MAAVPRSVGEQLKEWRQRRRLSQLELALDAEISARHVSFLETGRSQPSREMILRLAERLEVPMRERNVLLVAAGFAPVYPVRSLDDPALEAARKAIDVVLEAQKPFPAFALDRYWNVCASNAGLPEMYAGVDASLMTRPINAMRISLHPQGLAPRIVNLGEWRAHLLARLRQQVETTGDAKLAELLREVSGYPAPEAAAAEHAAAEHAIVVPFRIRTAAGVLSFFSTTTVFGTPVDVTLSELMVELFFPMDRATADAVRRLAQRTEARAAA
jgi:transcriptional regulator with XRE-family HTH domain